MPSGPKPRLCLPCVSPRRKPHHDLCTGWLLDGNFANRPMVRCECTDPVHKRDGSRTDASKPTKSGSTVRP